VVEDGAGALAAAPPLGVIPDWVPLSVVAPGVRVVAEVLAAVPVCAAEAVAVLSRPQLPAAFRCGEAFR